MTRSFATVDDVTTLFRSLTSDETAKCEALLPLLSDVLRMEAAAQGDDLDQRLMQEPYLASTVKIVLCSAIQRILRQNTEGEAMTQESQGALGYTWSGTYAVPGGGYANAFLDRELDMLGLRRQVMRCVEYDYGYHCQSGS